MGSAEEEVDEYGDQMGMAEHSCLHLEVWLDPLDPCRDNRREMVGHQHDAAAPAHSTEMGSEAAARRRDSAEEAHKGLVAGECNAPEGSSAAGMLEDRKQVALVQLQAHDDCHGRDSSVEHGVDADSCGQASEGSLWGRKGDSRMAAAACNRIAVERLGGAQVEAHCAAPVPHGHGHDHGNLHVAAN